MLSALWSAQRSRLVVLVTLPLLWGLGCGTTNSATPDADAGTGGTGTGGGGGAGGFVPPPPPPDCTTGDVRECKVDYYAGDVKNCFVGVQVCVDKEWEVCTTEAKVEERLVELGLGGSGGATP